LGGLSLQHLQEFTNLWAYTAMMSWTALLGSLPPMGSTLVLRLTRRNSSRKFSHAWTPLFGRFGRLPSANSSHGL
jgi:hypothetical protein